MLIDLKIIIAAWTDALNLLLNPEGLEVGLLEQVEVSLIGWGEAPEDKHRWTLALQNKGGGDVVYAYRTTGSASVGRRISSDWPFGLLKDKVGDFLAASPLSREVLRLKALADTAREDADEHQAEFRFQIVQGLRKGLPAYLKAFEWDLETLSATYVILHALGLADPNGDPDVLSLAESHEKRLFRRKQRRNPDRFKTLGDELHTFLSLSYHDSFDYVRSPKGEGPSRGYDDVSVKVDDGEIRLVFDTLELFEQVKEDLNLTLKTTSLEKMLQRKVEKALDAEKAREAAQRLLDSLRVE